MRSAAYRKDNVVVGVQRRRKYGMGDKGHRPRRLDVYLVRSSTRVAGFKDDAFRPEFVSFDRRVRERGECTHGGEVLGL